MKNIDTNEDTTESLSIKENIIGIISLIFIIYLFSLLPGSSLASWAHNYEMFSVIGGAFDIAFGVSARIWFIGIIIFLILLWVAIPLEFIFSISSIIIEIIVFFIELFK